jgi:hypothetical protein
LFVQPRAYVVRTGTNAGSACGAAGAWTVQATLDATGWDDGEAPCPACGDAVPLDGPHVAVQLVRADAPSPDRKRTLDYRRVACCDRACARDWLDARLGDE